MIRKNHRTLVAAGLLLVAVLAVLLPLSREPPCTLRAVRLRPQARASNVVESEDTTQHEATLLEIASLFRLAAPKLGLTGTHRRGSVSKPTPILAAPLRYLGWTTVRNRRSFIFVDSKTGRVLQLSSGQPCGGWALLEATADRFVLSNGTARFAAARR